MKSRSTLYLSGVVAASASYIFNVIAFTGTLDFLRLGVFLVFFLAVMAGFEKFIEYAEKLEQ